MSGSGTTKPKSDEKSDSGGSRLSMIATIVALVLLGAYLLSVYFLWPRVGAATPEAEWLRLTDLRGGLEALAFAAAGALLGTTVQRQATNQAEKRADKNEKNADAAKELAGAVRAVQGGGMSLQSDGRDPLAGLNAILERYDL